MWLLNLTAVLGLTCLIDMGHSVCDNLYPDAECDADAAIGECWFQFATPCRCQKSCNTSQVCPGAPPDDCLCVHLVASCDDTSYRNLCPSACQFRDTVVCDALLSVSHATPNILSPFYADKITYTCDTGFNQTGGEDGLRTCVTDGSWLVSTKTGIPPVCADNNECDLNMDDCDTNAQCINTPGSFTCSCNAGYSGDGTSGNCNDIDECALSTDDCDTNAQCDNTIGSFTCTCNVGLSGDGADGNCNGISCGPSPDIEGCVPSAPSGSYPDDITYDCVPGSMKLHGGTARHTCNALGVWTKDSNDTIPYCVYETEHYRTSVSEIDSAATPILATMTARSGLECARFCSLSPDCEGYTYSKSTQVCRHNVGPYLPIVTEMKKVYVQV